MNKSRLKVIVIWIISGTVIGSIIGAMGTFEIIPKTLYESISNATIKICLGLIVLIIDLLCLWGLFKPSLDNYIDKNGKSAVGIITNLQEIPLPNQLEVEEWNRKLRFACSVTYEANGKKHIKEFPPTHLTSKRELYPFELKEGAEIKLKYLKKFPKISLIDNDKLKSGYKKEHINSRIYLIMFPLIITAIFAVFLIFF